MVQPYQSQRIGHMLEVVKKCMDQSVRLGIWVMRMIRLVHCAGELENLRLECLKTYYDESQLHN